MIGNSRQQGEVFKQIQWLAPGQSRREWSAGLAPVVRQTCASGFAPVFSIECDQFLEARLDNGFLIEIAVSGFLGNL